MPVLERWTPFGDLDVVERRMRRMFEDLGVVSALTPPADIFETSDEFVVEVEVPGFAEEELDVEVSDHTLTVRGERAETTENKERTVRLHERLERRVERRFELPSVADSDHVSATYDLGVLTVRVPKLGAARSRKVEISS